jgi:hypothetical protein
MPLHSIGYQATAPGSGATAAAYPGDSLTVLNLGQNSPARIIAAWAYQNAAGYQQLTWPSGHDTTRGIRVVVPAATLTLWQLDDPTPTIHPGETITPTIAGSSTAGQIEQGILTLLYDDLPGIGQHLTDAQTVRQRAKQIVTVHATLTIGTAGGWSGEELITSESDLLKAGKEYAWLGTIASAGTHAVYLRSPETSGLRIACPVASGAIPDTREYFLRLSERTGTACIPIIRADNRQNTYIGGSGHQAGTAIVMSMLLAMLE